MFIRFKTIMRKGVGDTYAYLVENTWVSGKGSRQKVVAYLGKIKDFEKIITKEVYDKCNYRCALCGTQNDLSIDHIVPLSCDGSNSLSNLQILCRNCNWKKGKNKQSSLFGEVR